ncbi:MAG: transglycosylase SLT domain-containing protein [Elainellaceae cyanobacterium]
MLKSHKTKRLVGISAGLLGAIAGGIALSKCAATIPFNLPFGGGVGENAASNVLNLNGDDDSYVLQLVGHSPADRADELEAIANGESTDNTGKPTALEQSRARYLLANDLIEQGQAGTALEWLEGLEDDYPALEPAILYQRAIAYTATGSPEATRSVWQDLLSKFPDHPMAAEALFALGKTDPQYWDQALEAFPAHPRSIEIAQTRLSETSDQPQLLLLIAKYGLYDPEIVSVLDRLVNEYAAQLQPEDWQAIAFAYWENQYYGSASYAYENAPATPLNLYRVGRGAQLDERRSDAIAAYQRLVQEFPEAAETAEALLRLSRMVSATQAIAYLDQVIDQFPDQAAEALVDRAAALDELQSTESADQARQSVLSQHSNSDAAAEIRWQQAERHAERNDIKSAWEWAGQVVTENPDSELAPEAAFWVGKWAMQLGQQNEAKTAFEHVLTEYPESYYAWRSATFLGWDVGDFTTVRTKIPDLAKPSQRGVPPTGSDVLQELYLLGQDRDAWSMWQVEFQNPVQPTVAEQFTDGLMRIAIGDNLDGIFMLSSLSWRAKAEDALDYAEAKEQTAYWQALYPFPFLESIEAWSKERQINPVLVTALIRQESRFEPRIQSVVGATGLMQVMPSTADWIAQQTDVGDFTLNDPDDNLKLGTWYLDYTHEEYSNNSLFAVASYNAGPGSVADWIARFGFSDPDWFVEQIPFPETKGYVESVFENYWNYLRLYNPQVSKRLAQYSPKHAILTGQMP